MKLLLLADSVSSHTLKWVKSLHKRGYIIGLVSLYPKVEPGLAKYLNKNTDINFYPANPNFSGSFFSKLFVEKIFEVREIIKNFQPDIVHAHYASSYGLLGALSGFEKLIISVWGSDVFEFPHEKVYTKSILKYNLNRAKIICSTSEFMASETLEYTKRKIEVIPFGVDIDKFHYINRSCKKKPVVIGAIKSLEKIYGTDLLLEVFAKVVKKTNKNITLLLVGEGSLRLKLMQVAKELGVLALVDFRGYIGHEDIMSCYEEIDIFASFSQARESFGVSLVEAQATGLPIVVTPAGGFVEIIKSENEGFIVDPLKVDDIVDKFLFLIENKEERLKMGLNGRNKVVRHYDWQKCVDLQEVVYKNLIN